MDSNKFFLASQDFFRDFAAICSWLICR